MGSSASRGRSPEVDLAKPIAHLDGTLFKHVVIAGSRPVILMQEQLNNINVFPVADADTGTNMALTLRNVAEGALHCKETSIGTMSTALADAAFIGAHGSSGSLLAQFFQGLAEGFQGVERADAVRFAKAARLAADCAREAVAEPREGTILTVMRDWADRLNAECAKAETFPPLFASALKAATESLKQTPEKLEILGKAGVVDAGAQGFVAMLEGFQTFLETGQIVPLTRSMLAGGSAKARAPAKPAEIAFRFCTQALIVGPRIDRESLRSRIRDLGDSIIVGGSDERVHIHIHSNEPERVFLMAQEYGQLVESRHEDMHDQSARTHRNAETQTIAIITDSCCDLPPDDVIRQNIRLVPIRVIFGNDSYLDKITITDRDFYRLLLTSPTHPKTSQPPQADFQEVYSQTAETHREALAIIVSGALSGTLHAATAAVQAVKEKMNVAIIDSKNLSVGQGLIVREAVDSIESGATFDEVRARVQWAVENVRMYAGLETVEYLVRGGRLPRLGGHLAIMFNLKPILKMDRDGKVQLAGKAFSSAQKLRKMLQIVAEQAAGMHQLRFMVAHADAIDTARELAQRIRHRFDVAEIPIVPMSPAFGAHIGPGGVALAFLGSRGQSPECN